MRVSRPLCVTTERVVLRRVPRALARVLAGPGDAGAGERSWAAGYPLPGTRVAARALLARDDDGSGPWGMYEIILRASGQVIGDIGFHGPPDESGTVEIGYGIVKQCRGRGLVGEAAVAVCDLAWSSLAVNRIVAYTQEDDAASAGVLRHAGFQEDSAANGLRRFTLARP